MTTVGVSDSVTYILGEEGRNGAGEIFSKIMAEKSRKSVIGIKPQIQKAGRTPSRINITHASHTHTHTHTQAYSIQISENEREYL